MQGHDALYASGRAQALIAAGDSGGLIRMARRARGWRQTDLGKAAGYSASTISRLETAARAGTDLEMLRHVASAVGIPAPILGAVVSAAACPAATVTATPRREEGEPMRRRALVAAGLAVPAVALAALDEALTLLPDPARPATAADINGRLVRGRRQFDAGDLGGLLADLPDLIAAAHADTDRADDPGASARLAGCYDLASQALTKIGRYGAARITADRATTLARLSGDPIAMAAAARCLSVVLRHDNQVALADRVALDAATRLEATGLHTHAQRAAFARMLCTCGYTAAQVGDRSRALELIGDAGRAAAGLLARPVPGRSVTPAQVALYEVSVHWSLGDAGAAIAAGRGVRAADLPTAERRGRLFTDLARAWWQWGKPEQAAQALLVAHFHAPAEVTDRPRIRAIAHRLVAQHPQVSGVTHLAAALGQRGAR
jgi:transcriptional regulator with XRE-family HTH domain